MKLEKRFPERRVVITGAGSGLGRELALQFASRGWNVCVAEKDTDRGETVTTEINNTGGRGIFVPCDVTRYDDLEDLKSNVLHEWNGLDVLVNNAGVAAAGEIGEIPLETWNWIIDINLKSVVYACKLFVPHFAAQNSGYIVNVASYAGFAAFPEMSCYSVTKSAVISLSESLRSELAPVHTGISVVCPSFFKTGLMDSFAYTDIRQLQLAEAFFRKSSSSAKKVAHIIIRSIEKNRFYVIPQLDAKLIWFFKRHFPRLYLGLLSCVYRKGLIEKYLGTGSENC